MIATTKTILGIETSCDETAAAVVRWSHDGGVPQGTILSNVVRSQWAEHAPYGGVVPEIAARAHAACLDEIVETALAEAGTTARDVDLIAATAGPGLIGGLLVGLSFAKALALGVGKPLIAINHLEAHALTAGLTDGRRPPYLLLLVSGGHTQTVAVRGIGDYVRIGTTIDDALGEAFDKTAKLLGLPAPGGPAVEAAARRGQPDAIALPRPMLGRAEPHFSLAGLKTAVRRAALERAPVTEQDIADICASFQAAVADIVADRLKAAIAAYEATVSPQCESGAHSRMLVMAGGVAANAVLRSAIERVAETRGYGVVAPPPALCTDNAAMIAWAAGERVAAGLSHDDRTVSARPRWPLDGDAAPQIGSGRLGAKA